MGTLLGLRGPTTTHLEGLASEFTRSTLIELAREAVPQAVSLAAFAGRGKVARLAFPLVAPQQNAVGAHALGHQGQPRTKAHHLAGPRISSVAP